MAAVKILCTALMFAILIYTIIKKYKSTIILIALGLLAITVVNLIQGTVPGESGNFFTDLFELVANTFTKQLAGTAFTCMCAVAYVRFMDRMKAADMFVVLATKPLKGFKKPYLLVSIAMVMMCVINLFVASASGRVALYLATIYPLMMAVGVTPATAAAAILICASYWCVGPTASLVITALGLGDTTLTPVEQFIQYDLKTHIPVLVLIIVVFIIVNKAMDKKDAAKGIVDEIKDQKELSADAIGVPKWFAFLPALPLVFCVIFSPLVISTVKISVPGAVLMSWFIASVCNLIAGKQQTFKERLNFAAEIFNDLGEALKTTGVIVACASVFSAGLTAIGGMKELVNLATSGSGSGIFVGAAAITTLYGVSLAVTGSANANCATYATMLAGLCTGTDYSWMLSMMMCGGNIFCGLSPVAAMMIIMTGSTGIDSTRLLKRNLITSVACLVGAIGVTFIFYSMA